MDERIARQPMPWLRPRLRAMNATASDLARHLKLPPVRVYEMINGKRKFQPAEIAKTASFLKIGEEQLVGLIDGSLNASDVGIADVGALPWATSGDTGLPLLRATLSSNGFWSLHAKGDNNANTQPAIVTFSATAFVVIVQDERNAPVYRARDCILIDPEISVYPGDDVVLSSAAVVQAGQMPEIIPGQLTNMNDDAWSLTQYAIGTERVFSRERVPGAWKIISRFAPVRNLSQVNAPPADLDVG